MDDLWEATKGSIEERVADWWDALGKPSGRHTRTKREEFLVSEKGVSQAQVKAGRRKLFARRRLLANKYAPHARIPYHRRGTLRRPPVLDEEGRELVARIPAFGTQIWQKSYAMETLMNDPKIWQRSAPKPPSYEQIKAVIHFDVGRPMMFYVRSRDGPDGLWEQVNQHAQSAALADRGEPTHVTITTYSINRPEGRGSRMTPVAKDLESALSKTGVYTIHNPGDSLCFDRSLAILLNQAWRTTHPAQWKRLINHKCTLQKELAIEIRQRVGLDPTMAISLAEVPLYEETFKVDIRVWMFRALGPFQVYGPDCGNKNRFSSPRDSFHVLLEGEHFCPTINISSVLGHQYWDADLEAKARKPKACFQCKSEACEDKERPCSDEHHCADCNRRFKSDKCFDMHRSRTLGAGSNTRKKSTCEAYYQCAQCGKTQERFDPSEATGPKWRCVDPYNYEFRATESAWPVRKHVHRCGYVNCKSCGLYCDLQNHTCFVEKPTMAPKKNGPLYFYDLETTSDNEARRHVVNHVHAQEADGTEHSFRDMEGFMAFATSRAKGSIFFAHNGGKFDTNFILDYVLTCCETTPQILKANGRILSLQTCGIHFRDSYPHISAPLAQFSKMFNLPGEKGFFPHGFNLRATQNYVGPLPDIEFYCADFMSPRRRAEVHAWHAEQVAKGVVFDFQKEMAAYCKQDVTLLRLGVLEYQRIVREVTGYDPLVKLTIASAGFDYFVRDIMPEKAIENISRDHRRMDSAEAREWLAWCEQGLQRSLLHEYKVGRYTVDGYDPDTRTVYEFNGCIWHGSHGCHECSINPHSKNPRNGMSMHELADRTRRREEFLKQQGFAVVTETSCGFKQLRRTAEYKGFKKQYDEVAPITKRDALFGGRTDVGRMYWKSADGSVARYVDFTSLYPYVLKYCSLPVGAHTRVQGPEAQALDVPALLASGKQGILKMTVVCPDSLRFAVLPVLCEETGRLVFRCGEKTGVWTTVEVALALEMGYRITRVHEAWLYEQQGKIFEGYINTFYRLKAQATGRPAWVKTEEDLDEYIRRFEAKEGIKLDKDSIVKNPGLRAVAKLYLNSSWGRLAMRDTHLMMQTKIISNPRDFFQLLDNPAYNWGTSEFEFVGPSGGEKAYFTLYGSEDMTDGSSDRTNPVMASFVTSHARVKLYRLLNSVGHESVLYMDTDSALYVETPENAWLFKPTEEGGLLGDNLGELTDETDGQEIVEFVCLAPKTYAYRLSGNEEVVKSKGLSLNWRSSQTINLEGYRKKLFQSEDTKLEIQFDSLRKARETSNYAVFTQHESKEIKALYSKGVIMPDWSVRPFGHRDVV